MRTSLDLHRTKRILQNTPGRRRLRAVIGRSVQPADQHTSKFLSALLTTAAVINLKNIIAKNNATALAIHGKLSEDRLVTILETVNSPDLVVENGTIRIPLESLESLLLKVNINIQGDRNVLRNIWITRSVAATIKSKIGNTRILGLSAPYHEVEAFFSDAEALSERMDACTINDTLYIGAKRVPSAETFLSPDKPLNSLRNFNRALVLRGEKADMHAKMLGRFFKKNIGNIALDLVEESHYARSIEERKVLFEDLDLLCGLLAEFGSHEINHAFLDELFNSYDSHRIELGIEAARYFADKFPDSIVYSDYEIRSLNALHEAGQIRKIAYLEDVIEIKQKALDLYRAAHNLEVPNGKRKKKKVKGTLPRTARIATQREKEIHLLETRLKEAKQEREAKFREIWRAASSGESEQPFLDLLDTIQGRNFLFKMINEHSPSFFTLMRVFQLAGKKQTALDEKNLERPRLLALKLLFEKLEREPLGGVREIRQGSDGRGNETITIIPDNSPEGRVRKFLGDLAADDTYVMSWKNKPRHILNEPGRRHRNQPIAIFFHSINAQGHLEKANQLAREDKHQEALVEYELALEADPDNKAARNNASVCIFRMADSRLKKGNTDEIQQIFEKAVEYNGHNIDALHRLSLIHAIRANFAEVERYTRRILEILSSPQMKTDPQLKWIKPETVDTLRVTTEGNLGMALISQYIGKDAAKVHEAKRYLIKAKEAEPDNPNHCINLTPVYLSFGELNNAIEVANRYLELMEKRAAKGKTEGKVFVIRLVNDFLKHAIKYDIKTENQAELKALFEKIGENVLSLPDDLINSSEGAIDDLITASIHLFRIGMRDLGDRLSLHLLDLCKRSDNKDYPFACYERAIILYANDRFEEAIELLKTIIREKADLDYRIYSEFTGEATPIKANAINLYAHVLRKMSEIDKNPAHLDKGIEMLDAAVEEFPDTAIIHYSRGTLYEERNRSGSKDLAIAANAYRTAKEKCDGFMMAHLTHIDALRQLGRVEKMEKAITLAEQNLDKVLKNPEQASYIIATDFNEALIKLYLKTNNTTLHEMIIKCLNNGQKEDMEKSLRKISKRESLPPELRVLIPDSQN